MVWFDAKIHGISVRQLALKTQFGDGIAGKMIKGNQKVNRVQ